MGRDRPRRLWGRGGGRLQLAAVRSNAERECAAGACPGADVPRGRGCGAQSGARGGPGQGAHGLRLRGRVGEGQPRAPPRPALSPAHGSGRRAATPCPYKGGRRRGNERPPPAAPRAPAPPPPAPMERGCQAGRSAGPAASARARPRIRPGRRPRPAARALGGERSRGRPRAALPTRLYRPDLRGCGRARAASGTPGLRRALPPPLPPRRPTCGQSFPPRARGRARALGWRATKLAWAAGPGHGPRVPTGSPGLRTTGPGRPRPAPLARPRRPRARVGKLAWNRPDQFLPGARTGRRKLPQNFLLGVRPEPPERAGCMRAG